MNGIVKGAFTCALLGSLVAAASPARAQDDKKLGWSLTTELTGVWTAGNSESNTFGVDATAMKVMTDSQLKLRAGGTQTQSSLITRTAMGTSEDFTINENKVTEKTAELYYGRGRYDHDLNQSMYAFGGLDWLRNTFAGIDSRFLIAVGAGKTWTNTDTRRFKTDVGVTYTFQADVVENPFTKTSFPGIRFSYEFWSQLTGSTEFKSELTVDWNLDNTDDVRADWLNELPVKISEKFFLKPSLQLLWRNDPALTSVPLVDSEGVATGTDVLVPLKELDSLFTLALVMKF